MISIERFLALLEEKDLLSPLMTASLRMQLARAKKPIPVASIAQWLVKHGHITLAQAKRLLAAGEEVPPPSKSAAAGYQPEIDEEELGFAPLEGESDDRRAPAKPVFQPRPEQPAAKPRAEKADSTRQTTAQPRQTAPAVKSAGADSLLDEEMPSPGGPPDDAAMGPLDNLLSDAAMVAAASGSLLTPLSSRGGGLRRFFSRKPRIRKTSEDWGSSLMLIGGGSLLVLLILGGALLWSLTRSSGDAMLQLASDDYRAGSYAQAIHKYRAYLEKFPNHSGASVARVRIGLAQLRQATQGAANWPAALQAAVEVLTAIAAEADFKEAHGELAAMLSAIAEGLAADARKKTDPALVDQTRQALAMTEKYVPKSLRPASKLADVEASLALTVREIARGNELDKATAAMLEMAKHAKTQEAYELCNALLRRYPESADDAKLQEALLAVSREQKALVKIVEERKPAETSERPTAVLSAATPVQSNLASEVAGAEGRIVLAAVDGAVYGLDAATGKVLWRRFVGFDANPQGAAFPPMPISSEPDSDALLVDTVHNEVLRVEGRTGRLRWRHVVGEPFDAYPVVADDRVLAATRSGKLIAIDAISGDSSSYVQLPQALRVAPAVDARRSLVFQVADHTNLFVLSLADGACKQVVHLGHRPGSATTAPVLAGNYLFLAINDGANDATLHALAIQTDKSKLSVKPVQQVRLTGRVQTAPLTAGRSVLVATDRGSVRAFEIGGTDAKLPLHGVAETALNDAEKLIRFGLLQGGQLWIADKQLAKYDLQVARGRLVPKWIIDEQSAFLQPPVAVGQAVISVRRKLGLSGAFVSAVAAQEPVRLWETRLAVPLASEPLVADGGETVIAVASDGAVFQIDGGKGGFRVVDHPLASADAAQLQQPVDYVASLPNGLLAIATGAGADQIGILDPQQRPARFRWLKVPDKLACPPIAFAGGLLVPSKVGQVLLLDLDGSQLAEPFQPRLELGEEPAWRTPAAVNDKELVLADGAAKLYRLAISDQPKPHLTALAQATASEPIVSPVAVVGETAYAVDAKGMLAAFELPKLTRGKGFALSGRCVFGPVRLSDRVLAATDDDQLVCMGAKGERLWQVPMPYGPLAGAPLPTGGHYLLASRSGVVWRLDAANGKELGKVEVGLPLGSGPVLLGRQLLVGGHDGTLYEVRQP